MPEKTTKTSFLLRKTWEFYHWLSRTVINSLLNKISETLLLWLKNSLKYSFLERISEVKNVNNNLMVLKSSGIIIWLLELYRKIKKRSAAYFKMSAIREINKKFKEELYSMPFFTVGIITAVAVITNMAFSLFFHKEIGLFGFSISLFFLFIGFCGLFSDSDLESAKRTSLIMKYINNYCKIRKLI
jgi:hypothetical protein